LTCKLILGEEDDDLETLSEGKYLDLLVFKLARRSYDMSGLSGYDPKVLPSFANLSPTSPNSGHVAEAPSQCVAEYGAQTQMRNWHSTKANPTITHEVRTT